MSKKKEKAKEACDTMINMAAGIEAIHKADKKLPADVKAKWVEALRSGKYHQGRKYLYGPEGFCCLGVLYDVLGGSWSVELGEADAECPLHLKAHKLGAHRTSCGWYVLGEGDVPQDVMAALPQIKLAIMNDNGYSFAEIADYIEREL